MSSACKLCGRVMPEMRLFLWQSEEHPQHQFFICDDCYLLKQEEKDNKLYNEIEFDKSGWSK